MSKKLCKKKKKTIDNPRFICRKCDLMAQKKKDLCKPESL